MSLESDFTVSTGAKTVTHSSGTEVFTVLAFFQWLAAKFAATGFMDDDFPFVSDTPQVYRWTNGWDMGDETSYQFLKGGAVATADYVPNTSGKLFSNAYTIGSQFRDSMIYIVQNDAEIAPWWSPGNIDILIKVDDSGYIASGIVTAMSRDTDVLYDHNDADLSAGGRNPVGVNTAEDLNYKSSTTVFVGDIYLDVDNVTNWNVGNFAYGVGSTASGRVNGIDATNTRLYLCQVEGTFTTSESIVERATRTGSNLDGSSTNHATTAEFDVVRGYNDISITFGSISRDLNNGNGAQNYDVEIDCAARTMAQVYRYLKYVVAHNSSSTINGDAGEEYRSANEPTYAEVKQAPFGTFAGGTFFGARGVWVTNYAAATFQLTDASGNQQIPPNYQIANVSHTDLSGCYILIAERSGTAIIKNQYTIQSVTSNTITATATIDGEKAPQSGTLRVGDTVYSYTDFTTDTFNGVSPDPTGETGSLYVPILDVQAGSTSEDSDQLIAASAFDVKIRVRKYGFKDYTVDGSFPTGGLNVVPILATDPQAS
jgi:hypothetical protein